MRDRRWTRVRDVSGLSLVQVKAPEDPRFSKKMLQACLYLNHDIVVIRQQSDHLQIMVRKIRMGKGRMKVLARVVRMLEQERRGGGEILPAKTWSSQPSSRESGSLPTAMRIWYLDEEAGWLFNSRGEATILTDEDLAFAIRAVFEEGFFQKDVAPDCRRGHCRSTKTNPCPWYDFFLPKCWEVRKSETTKKELTPTR